jgi:SAM-dependent methyltransferase
LVEQLRRQYGAVGASDLSGAQAGVRAIAEAFGYTPEELAALPAGANLGLSCGNPTAFANLRPGETVVDLGCGGGLDVLLAARKVGPAGRAVGIDMTPEMIARARANARLPVGGRVLENVEFHLASIDRLPLADDSVDCLVSNCVINLAPDKSAVFREMLRVLRPGGRVALSDIALKKPLPAELARDVQAFVGCIAGALLMGEYERRLREAGFEAVQVQDAGKDLSAYALLAGQSACCSPAMSSTCLPPAEACCGPAGGSAVHEGLAELLRKYDVNDYAASVCVYALKGRGDSAGRGGGLGGR